jgi:hypothetical protein
MPKSIRYRKILTLGDGNCALNVVALALRDLAQQNKLPALSSEKKALILAIYADLRQGKLNPYITPYHQRLIQPMLFITNNEANLWATFMRRITRYNEKHTQVFTACILRELLFHIITNTMSEKATLYRTPLFQQEFKNFIQHYFYKKCGYQRSDRYPRFEEIEAFRIKLDTLYNEHIYLPIHELSAIPTDELDDYQSAQLAHLTHVSNILRFNPTSNDADDQLLIDNFFRPIIADMHQYWLRRGVYLFAGHLRNDGKWTNPYELMVLTDFLNLTVTIEPSPGYPEHVVENRARYPQSFIDQFNSEAHPQALRQQRQQQLTLLRRENIISDPFFHYCELNPRDDADFMTKINRLREHPDFDDFDFEWLIRLNFENNRPRTRIYCEQSRNHWSYLRPHHHYRVDPSELPDHMVLLPATPYSLHYKDDPQFRQNLVAVLDNQGATNCIENCQLLADAYLEDTRNDDNGVFTAAELNRSELELEHTIRTHRNSLLAFCDTLYLVIRRSEAIKANAQLAPNTTLGQVPLNHQLIRFLLSQNKYFASYYQPEMQQPHIKTSLLYLALSGLDLELITLIREYNPEALQQPPVCITENDSILTVASLPVALSNEACTAAHVAAFIDAGIPIGGTNSEKKTALQIAIERGDYASARLLVHHQSRPHLGNDHINLLNRDNQDLSIIERLPLDNLQLIPHQLTRQQDMHHATLNLIENLALLQQDAIQLADHEPRKIAAVDLVTNIFLETKHLEQEARTNPDAVQIYLQSCHRVIERNMMILNQNEFYKQLTLNIVYALTVVGTLHLISYYLYNKLWTGNSTHLFFASALQQKSRETASIIQQLVDGFTSYRNADDNKQSGEEPIVQTLLNSITAASN